MRKNMEDLMEEKIALEKARQEQEEQPEDSPAYRVRVYGIAVSVLALVIAAFNLLFQSLRGPIPSSAWILLLVMLAILAANIAIYKTRNRGK